MQNSMGKQQNKTNQVLRQHRRKHMMDGNINWSTTQRTRYLHIRALLYLEYFSSNNTT